MTVAGGAKNYQRYGHPTGLCDIFKYIFLFFILIPFRRFNCIVVQV